MKTVTYSPFTDDYIVVMGAVRTPIGKFGGALAGLTAAELGSFASRGALRRAGISPADLDEVIFGCARQAGGGPNVARQIGHRAGVPVEVPAFTINKACGSGLKAVLLAAQAIRDGDARIILAGGSESMSRVPYLVETARWGAKPGDAPLVDGMYRDGFLCPLCNQLMGETGEALADRYSITREDQDRFAASSPAKGILLSGPPGTGKTLLAKALAKESQVNFVSVKGPELLSQWVGASEKGIREVFRKAKQAAPCILFFDEIDSLVPARGHSGDSGVAQRVVSQLLTELDGIEELKGVVVLGATNRQDIIDPAILRSGRFDLLLDLPLPDKAARLAILQIHTRGKPLAKGVSLPAIADATEGRSGADLAGLCGKAALLAIREHLATHKDPAGGPARAAGYGGFTISMKHMEAAHKIIERQRP